MTTEQKIIRAKVGLLELAKQLGNVSQACKMMGYRAPSSQDRTRCRKAAGAWRPPSRSAEDPCPPAW